MGIDNVKKSKSSADEIKDKGETSSSTMMHVSSSTCNNIISAAAVQPKLKLSVMERIFELELEPLFHRKGLRTSRFISSQNPNRFCYKLYGHENVEWTPPGLLQHNESIDYVEKKEGVHIKSVSALQFFIQCKDFLHYSSNHNHRGSRCFSNDVNVDVQQDDDLDCRAMHVIQEARKSLGITNKGDLNTCIEQYNGGRSYVIKTWANDNIDAWIGSQCPVGKSRRSKRNRLKTAFYAPPEQVSPSAVTVKKKKQRNFEPPQLSCSRPPKKMKVPLLFQLNEIGFDAVIQRVAHIPALRDAGAKGCAGDIAHFFLFCYERQQIWVRKNRDEQSCPFTKDQRLRDYKFCNVYRELDRGTQYFRSMFHGIQKKKSSEGSLLKRTLFASVVYRLVNKVDTFDNFGGIPTMDETKKFLKWMEKQKQKGMHVFTGQHQTVSLATLKATLNKLPKQLDDICSEIENASHLQCCWESLLRIKGVGPFFAWQIICDVVESGVLSSSLTEEQWCKLGPGAKNGIATCFQKASRLKCELTALDKARLLRDIQGDVFLIMNIMFPKFDDRPITLKNIEHVLCEFQKYVSKSGKLSYFVSRCHLDDKKSCQLCTFVKEEMLFCDGCLDGYCFDCIAVPAGEEGYWFCASCKEVPYTP